jgi:large subunit ribosomal protein L18e
MKSPKNKKTNPRLLALIDELKAVSRDNQVNIWQDIAARLETSSKNYAEVNLSKISRYAADGETILVPGKVLGDGILEASVRVAALNFSQSASDKIRGASGECLSIEQLIRDNPKGSKIRILR